MCPFGSEFRPFAGPALIYHTDHSHAHVVGGLFVFLIGCTLPLIALVEPVFFSDGSIPVSDGSNCAVITDVSQS